MMSDLTEERIAEYKEAFALYDKDGGGRINAKELGTLMRSLGQDLTEVLLHDLINELDTDGDGLIDFPEFLALMVSNKTKDGVEAKEIGELFYEYDKDGSGFISAGELLTIIGEAGEHVINAEVNEMIRAGDIDGDGQINYDEFCEGLGYQGAV